jgi:site-specific recombinase XerD
VNGPGRRAASPRRAQGHALRHACAVELLRRTKNLRAVQKHLRHADIGTTTIHARLLPQELQEIVTVFDADP